jgi:hypothetical protein
MESEVYVSKAAANGAGEVASNSMSKISFY